MPVSTLPRVGFRHARVSGVLLLLVCAACQEPHYRTDQGDAVEGKPERQGRDASTSGSPRDATDASRSDPRASVTSGDGGTGTTAEPTIKPDASGAVERPDVSKDDAGVPLMSTVPKWAIPLIGRYATRSFAFKQDQYGTVTRAEQLAIVEFALDGPGMTLRSKTCLSLGDNKTAQLRVVDPGSLPERLEQVVFSELERSWSTIGSTYVVGFTRQPTAACEGKQGQSTPKTEAQAWLTGSTCRCVAAAEKPTKDDCRVLDPDHDKKPGLSFMLKGFSSSLLDGTLYGASESDTHYVGGKVGAEGTAPTASINAADRNYQFGCDSATCFEIADLGTPCPIALSQVRFIHLDEATTTTCADVAANVNTLFPSAVPPIPASCL